MFEDIIYRIRLPFRKDRQSYLVFYRMLGFLPHDLRYYRIALLHKSSSLHKKKGRPVNNERLEYLGDAVLEAVVSDILFDRYSDKGEGFLTNTRSKIVQRETLNDLAVRIGLDKMTRFTQHSTTHNNNMFGNAFEALMGAIYLDRGYMYCLRFIRDRIMRDYIDIEKMARQEQNHKSRLLEWCQRRRYVMTFNLVDQSIDAGNSPTFHSEAIIEGLIAGDGEGYSKKESQQNAARSALKRIKRDELFVKHLHAMQHQRMTDRSDDGQDDSRYLEE